MIRVQKRIINFLAVKIALSALLAVLISYGIGWQSATDFVFFAPFSVCINMLMFPDQSANNWMMIERLLGVSAGYLLGIFSLAIFPHQSVFIIIYASVITFICCYLIGIHHKNHYVFFLLFIILDIIVAFHFFTPTLNEKSWQLPASVAIALLSLYLINFILPKEWIRKSILSHKDKLFNDLITHIQSSQTQRFNLLRYDLYQDVISRFPNHLNSKDLNYLQRLTSSLKSMSYELNLILDNIESDNALNIFARKKYTQIKNRIALDIKDIKNGKIFRIDKTMRLINILESDANNIDDTDLLMKASKLIYDLNRVISHLQNIYTDTINCKKETKKLSIAKKADKKEAIYFSIKTVVSLLITAYLLKALNIPGLYQAWIACLVVIIMPNLGELLFKGLMRLSGIILGGCLGLLIGYISFRLHSPTLLFTLFTIIIFFAARFGLKYQKYEYAAIQFCLIFIMMLFTGGFGQLDFELGYQRFTGLFSGVLIALFVSFIFNPKLPSSIINQYIASIFLSLINQMKEFTQKSINREGIDNLNKKLQHEIIQAKNYQHKLSHIYLGYKKQNTKLLNSFMNLNHYIYQLNATQVEIIKHPDLCIMVNELIKSVQLILFYFNKNKVVATKDINLNLKRQSLKHLRREVAKHRNSEHDFKALIKCVACFSAIIHTLENLAKE